MDEKGKLTIYDIAKMAGVSSTTVSRAMNGSGYVAKEKKDRILKVIEESGFKPNAFAKGLTTRRSGTIGMLVPDVINPFYATMFTMLEREALKHDYNVILCNYYNDNSSSVKQIALLEQKQVDVLLHVGGPTDLYEIPQDLLEVLEKVGKSIPIITNGNSVDGRFISVQVNDDSALDSMLVEAYAKGYRKFAIVGGDKKYIPTFNKWKQFEVTLRRLNVPAENRKILEYDNFDSYGGEKCVELLIDEYGMDIPTFIVGINESVAIGVEKGLIKRGYKVPEDVSVVGFDNTYLSEMMSPSLSSIGCDYDEYAKYVISIILDVIESGAGGKHDSQLYVNSKYVKRESTAI
ncbi:LacI family DNA-binding transcriptional regulator [Butyrivibrio sp. YAB3001]|uniref:LacI family DNA-binding transcriptional regulator n=1 Tax=Butyrivibrio sp. YAB3001 TaxID=1520812 RepID=UPI0008F649B6|nr:LacI family DNA-binding transcriptional regulator [Butyrivibrio sp. YAB3001]SFC27043.1 transcriptional regulator, LacI family [Butyrivibrio sp. YAB3001]